MSILKRILKNILAIICILVVFSVSVLIGVSLYNQGNTVPENVVVNEKESNYDIYINTGSLVKLSFKETYRTCTLKGIENNCGGYKDTITSYKLLNTKATKTYKDIDFREMILEDAIKIIVNQEDVKHIDIVTNWNKTEDNINKLIYDNTNFNLSINTNIDNNINEENLNNYLDIETTYTVKFNSNKGTKVSSVKVNKNDKVSKPKNPTRKGYVFVEWQLKNKKYDFNKPVTKDITLKAKWKKK